MHKPRLGRALLFVLVVLTPLTGTSAASAATMRVEPDGSGHRIVYTGLDASESLVYARAYTRFTELYVRRAHAGSRIRMRCKGAGCPPRAKHLRVRRSAPKLTVTRVIRGARLRPGARLEVRITRRGHLGVVARFTIRARQRPPKRTDRCLRPGARRSIRCPI